MEKVFSRQQDWITRAIVVPVAALVASHIVFTKLFPWQNGYSFPWPYFFTVATVMLACWEVNLRLFWWLDTSLPFYENPSGRIVRQVAINATATLLTFLTVFSLSQRIYVGHWPSFSMLLTGGVVCATIASLINGAYIALYLTHAINWQKSRQTAKEKYSLQTGPHLQKSSSSLVRVETPLGYLQFPLHELAYFYSSGGVVLLVKTDGQRHTTSYSSLGQLAEQFERYDSFFTISRQFVTSVRAISAIKEDTNRKVVVSLVPALRQVDAVEEVVVSRYRSGEFKKWFAKSSVE